MYIGHRQIILERDIPGIEKAPSLNAKKVLALREYDIEEEYKYIQEWKNQNPGKDLKFIQRTIEYYESPKGNCFYIDKGFKVIEKGEIMDKEKEKVTFITSMHRELEFSIESMNKEEYEKFYEYTMSQLGYKLGELLYKNKNIFPIEVTEEKAMDHIHYYMKTTLIDREEYKRLKNIEHIARLNGIITD